MEPTLGLPLHVYDYKSVQVNGYEKYKETAQTLPKIV